MQNQDWEKWGNEIKRTVQDAIDSQDFNKLNQTITNTINDAIGGVRSGMRSAGDAIDGKGRNSGTGSTDGRKSGSDASWNNARSANGRTRSWNAGNREQVIDQQQIIARRDAMLYAKPTGTKVGGIIMTVLGSVFGLGTGLSLLAVLIYASVLGVWGLGVTSSMITFGSLTAVNLGLLIAGTRKIGFVSRFYRYRNEVKQTGYCEVKRLAAVARKSDKKVIKELQKMIDKRWFKEGHMDDEETCLIASNAVYKDYTDMIEGKKLNAENERIRQEKEAQDEETMSPEVRTILREGHEYIQKIHECNDAIPGIEISAKISRMEELVDRIFDRVEEDPSTVTSIQRLMNYYLPTTVKLLEAYEQLDGQPVQGENIISSKQEIEKTLDTLNSAFEKLLDDLFEKTAWDVSSDISVLNTMLAQEGLGENDFKK